MVFSVWSARLKEILTHADGLRSALAFSLILLLLSLAGWLNSWNFALQDALAPYRLNPDQSSSVLLVTASPAKDYSADEWLGLCDHLAEAGARRIVVGIPLGKDALTALSGARCKDKLLVGLAYPENQADQRALIHQFDALRDQGLRAGLLKIGEQRDETRYFTTAFEFQGRVLPALEALAAMPALANDPQRITPDFRLAPALLPELSMRRALDEGIVSNLAKDKLVLLTYEYGAFMRSVQAPGYETAVSLGRYQGMLIDALDSNAQLHWFGPFLKAASFLAVVLLMGLFLQPLTLRSGVVVLCLAITLDLLLAFIALWLWAACLPVVELVMLEIAIFITVYRSKASREAKSLRDLLVAASSKLQRRMQPVNILQADEPWHLIARLIDQTLNLRRMIFLERIEGDHRLREIVALRCGLSDIDERRRDFERTPYTTAIAARGPILVERYLAQHEEAEQQYLVPLMAAGELIGFWAFGIDRQQLSNPDEFARSVREIAVQLADLMYQRKLRKALEERHGRSWLRLMEDDNIATYRALEHSLRMIEQRLHGLECVFNLQTNAAVLYDLFGRVVLLNSQMGELLAGDGATPYRMSVTEFIAHVSQRPIEEIRSRVKELVMHQLPISLPLALAQHPQRHLLLEVRALVSGENKGEEGESVAPFSLLGILVEFVDVSEARKIGDMKSDLTLQAGYKLSNSLESLLLAIHVMQQQDTSAEQRQFVGELAEKSLDEAADVVRRIKELLSHQPDDDSERPYPLDPLPILDRVLHKQAACMEQLKLSFTFIRPNFQTLAMATPDRLEVLLEAIIYLLAQDALVGTSLSLKLCNKGHKLELLFANTGLGTPGVSLAAYEPGAEISTLPPTLEALQLDLAAWGGKLSLHSVIGQGTQIVLELETFWN